MKALLVAVLVVLAAPVAAQTPVAHAGDSVRFDQASAPAYSHFYLCYDAEQFCERIERAEAFVDGTTLPGHVSYTRRLPALTDGPHRVVVWVFYDGGNQFTSLDFVYDNAPAPPPTPGTPQAPVGLRFWRQP